MNMTSPIGAMLWESWRLTRLEVAQRLAIGIGVACVAWLGKGATLAFWVLVWTHAIIWLSIARLNGGKFLDGYKPGFPLYLLYTRPVPTAVIAGVAMAYDALSGALLYALSAMVVGLVFGATMPLLPVMLWLAVGRLAYACIQWSTRSRTVQWGASMVVYLPLFMLLKDRLQPPLQVEFQAVDVAVLVVMGVVAFGLTVWGVQRQRCGDAAASVPKTAAAGGFPLWLITLFRFPCPTTSATRAQVWFELRSSGLPILAVGVASALLLFLLFAAGIFLNPARPMAFAFTLFFVPIALVVLGGNAFGLRQKQGRRYASLFEITQPANDTQLAAVKVLVRSVCVLLAVVLAVTSGWLSSSLIEAWGPWLADGANDARDGLIRTRLKLGDAFGLQSGLALALQALIGAFAIIVSIALRAALGALRMRYPRGTNLGLVLVLACFAGLIALAVAATHGVVPWSTVRTCFTALLSVAGTAWLLVTGYLSWCVLREQLFSSGQGLVVVALCAVCAAGWLQLLRIGGISPMGTSLVDTFWRLSPVLLPLTLALLAPWSLGRVRHA